MTFVHLPPPPKNNLLIHPGNTIHNIKDLSQKCSQSVQTLIELFLSITTINSNWQILINFCMSCTNLLFTVH